MIHDRTLVIALAGLGLVATVSFAADRFVVSPHSQNRAVSIVSLSLEDEEDADLRAPGMLDGRAMSTGFVYLKKAEKDFSSAYARSSQYAQSLDGCLDVPDDFAEAIEEGREFERRGVISALKNGRDEHDLPAGIDRADLLSSLERLTLLYAEHSSVLGDHALICGDLKIARRIVSEDIPRFSGIAYHTSVRDLLLAEQKRLRSQLAVADRAFQDDPEAFIEEIGSLLDSVSAFDDTVEALSAKPAATIQAIRADERIMGSAILALAKEGDRESAGHLSSELKIFRKQAVVFEKSATRPVTSPAAFLTQTHALFTKKAFINRVLRDLSAQ